MLLFSCNIFSVCCRQYHALCLLFWHIPVLFQAIIFVVIVPLKQRKKVFLFFIKCAWSLLNKLWASKSAYILNMESVKYFDDLFVVQQHRGACSNGRLGKIKCFTKSPRNKQAINNSSQTTRENFQVFRSSNLKASLKPEFKEFVFFPYHPKNYIKQRTLSLSNFIKKIFFAFVHICL